MSEEIKGVKEFLKYCENFKEAIKNISNFEKKCGRYIDVEINRRKNKAEDISNYEKEDFFENFKYGLKGAFEGCFGVPLKNKVNSPAKIVLKDIVKKMIKSKKIEDLKKVFDLDKYIKKLKGGINSRICDKEVKKEFESFENKVEELFEEYKGILEKVKKSAEAKQMIKEVIRSVEIAADESEEHLLTGLVEKRLSELQELVNKLNELGGKEKSIIEIIGNAKKLIGAKIDEELGRLSELVFSARNREEYVQDSIKEMSEKIKKREVDGLENEIEKIEEELKELKNDENDLNESLKITVLDEEIIFEKLIERSDFNLGRLEGMLKRVKDDYGKCLEDLPNIEKGINYDTHIRLYKKD